MAALEELAVGALVLGLNSSGPVSIVSVKWNGASSVTVVYAMGRPAPSANSCSFGTRKLG